MNNINLFIVQLCQLLHVHIITQALVLVILIVIFLIIFLILTRVAGCSSSSSCPLPLMMTRGLAGAILQRGKRRMMMVMVVGGWWWRSVTAAPGPTNRVQAGLAADNSMRLANTGTGINQLEPQGL
jgi:hypothetical protein